VGCPPAPEQARAVSVTWHGEVAELVERRCLPCHGSDGVATLRLESFDQASSVAPLVADAVTTGAMPPWGAEDTTECAPPAQWANDARLPKEEIAVFEAWAAAGAPEGEPSDRDEQTEIGAPSSDDRTLRSNRAWPLPETGPDTFRCFVLDPGLEEDAWISRVEVLPGVRRAVHHVLVFQANAADGEALAEQAEQQGGTLDCARGAPELTQLRTITLWAPGSPALEVPETAGIELAAGSRIVLQVHYHPTGEPGLADNTGVRLTLRPDLPSERAGMMLVGNAEAAPILQAGAEDPGGQPVFHVPAGARAHVETMVFQGLASSAGPLSVFGLAPHMHWVGVDMKVSVRKAGGEEVCLLHVPRYDFDWQRFYAYDSTAPLPLIEAGDALVIRCTYDNTLDNERLREALLEEGLDAPGPVGLGPNSLDEMCLVFLGATVGLNTTGE